LSGLTPGTTYTFRYRVANIHGWSTGYSPEAQIIAANVPSAPAAPTTQLVGSSVTVSWTAPASNGMAITAYVVEIQGAAGGWHLETTDCDGADSTIVTSASCTIPQATLQAGSFVLLKGDLVSARVSAINVLGTGAPSAANTAGARIQSLPSAPTGLAQGPATSSTQIEVTWNAASTVEELGGAIGEVTITSYHIDWDVGTEGGPWAELAGFSSAYTANTFTTSAPAQTLTAGQTYRFRVRAQNSQGWGDYASPVSVLAASAPSEMAMVTMTDNAGLPSIRVTWVTPSSNGSPILAYEITILTATSGTYAAAPECDGAT
jgi:hypothetical protein